MRKKLTATLLCLAMCASSAMLLASCANSNNGAVTTAPPADAGEGEITIQQLPKIDMGGQDINFVIAETDGDGFHLRSIKPDDEESDDIVDIAIMERNARIEEYYNCNIVVANYFTNSLNSSIGSQLTAGVEDYDILCARQYDDVQLALRGVVYDLNMLELDYGMKTMNMDASYWSQTYNDGLQVGTGRYWVTGDICLRYTGGYYCYFVNHMEYNEKLSSYGSVYDLVRDGKWTLDLLTQMSAALWEDTDGDDKTSKGDQLAIAHPVWDNTNGLSISSGVQYSYRNEDGTIELTCRKGNPQLESFMSKMATLLSTPGVYNYGGGYSDALLKLAAGEAVFASGRLNQAELYLRDMEDDYGILPNPKLSEEQQQYVSSIHDGVQLYGISVSSPNVLNASLILEAMEVESRRTVRPMYFEAAVKVKYSRGGDDAEMIDLMDRTSYSDFVYVWQFSKEMNNMGDWLRNNVASKKGYTTINRVQGTWMEGLKAIQDEIKKLESANT